LKMKKYIHIFFLISIVLLSSCSIKEKSKSNNEKNKVENEESLYPQLSNVISEEELLMEIDTTAGIIKIKLFPEDAPRAVENFVKHSKEKYYDDISFHRTVKDFIIQSGDPLGDGTGGESIWGEDFVPEISDKLYHLNGALAVARNNMPVNEASQGSQFYIVTNKVDQTENIKKHILLKENNNDLLTEEDYPLEILEAYKKGGAPSLDNKYSVFGQVIEGLDVIEKISILETVEETPKNLVYIKSIREINSF